MTPQEQQVAHKIASLIRAARKGMGLTQIAVSQRLGISQSALSKVESGLLIPSAPQWFEFCSMTGISPDTLTAGFIDHQRPAVLEQGPGMGFRLKKYSEDRGSKTRAMMPFLIYFRSTYGQEKLEEYLRSVKVDPDFFVDLDNQISLDFGLDMARKLILDGNLKPKDFSNLVKPVTQPQVHGNLHRQYSGDIATLNRLQILLMNSRQYECNFQYPIEELTPTQLTFSITPERHMKSLQYREDPTLGDFLCRYKKHYFEQFSSYGGSAPVHIEELQCHYKGYDRCVYQIKKAA